MITVDTPDQASITLVQGNRGSGSNDNNEDLGQLSMINKLRAKASIMRDNWAEYFSTAEHSHIAAQVTQENKALSDKIANDSNTSLDRTTSKQEVYTLL